MSLVATFPVTNIYEFFFLQTLSSQGTFLVHANADIWNILWYILHRNKLCNEILSWDIEVWMKNHLLSDRVCNVVNL